ncbi:MAG: HDOD domain-containing protein [Sulfuricurvum sp.]|uniref:HDOD domain-containing protein n=1 Tax=Sulfuricurvum sp. TaxID=2025608 RepID=UPI002605D0D8|nr:HDOD domain-containing protein [Sulfuricurvum sp.]MDD2830167.1 HDOD domain-containing protein [Sulfuricurvum sp.]MDD4949231.1 HDOD domain-containing protein [Sulfuricurvum sp.]
MKPELMQQIEHVPMLPETVQKVEAVYNNPNSGVSEMANAIKDDPIITAYILKTANSPMYGLSRTVTDVAQAISLLGKDTVRTFTIASAANNCMDIDLSPYGMTQNNYLARAQLQNALVSRWVSKVDRSLLGHLSLASFLLELGKVVISRYLIESGQGALLSEALANGGTTKQAEIIACGSKSEDVTATLFYRWNFDPDLVHLIRFANEPEDASDPETQEMAKFLKVAKEAISLDGTMTEATLKNARELIEEYGMNQNLFDETVEKILAA